MNRYERHLKATGYVPPPSRTGKAVPIKYIRPDELFIGCSCSECVLLATRCQVTGTRNGAGFPAYVIGKSTTLYYSSPDTVFYIADEVPT